MKTIEGRSTLKSLKRWELRSEVLLGLRLRLRLLSMSGWTGIGIRSNLVALNLRLRVREGMIGDRHVR
jgi:hypothetical protein